MKRRTFLKNAAITAASMSMPAISLAELQEPFSFWNKPVEPFGIIGNIYYVGVSDVSSFLITSPEGHILIEGGFAETAPHIEKNIHKLGFKLEDVKILLTSHAHFDHAGGLAELKRITGGKLYASKPEAVMLANGGKGDFHFGDQLQFPPVSTDRIVSDNEQIQLGGVTMRSYLTPGHAKGCTTWTMTTTENGKRYNVVFVGSVSVPGYELKNNKKYPNIADDYTRSFEILKKLKCDIFLAPHSWDFNLKGKMAKRGISGNPFIDPDGYKKAIKRAENNFMKKMQGK